MQPQELMFLYIHTTYIHKQTCRQTCKYTPSQVWVTFKVWNYFVFSDIHNKSLLWFFHHLNKFLYTKFCAQFSVLYLEVSAIDDRRPTSRITYRLPSICTNIRDPLKHLNTGWNSSNSVYLWNAEIVNMRKIQHHITCPLAFYFLWGSLKSFTQGYIANRGNEYPLLNCQSYKEGTLQERNSTKNKEMNTQTACKSTTRIQKPIENKTIKRLLGIRILELFLVLKIILHLTLPPLSSCMITFERKWLVYQIHFIW